MTKRFQTKNWIQTTEADFQEWVTDLYSAFDAIGLVQTADTGQIVDPTTLPLPATNSTEAGYRMYRFDDALQATAPIYIRVGVGRGNSNLSRRITFHPGHATDGAGNLVDAPAYQVQTPSNSFSAGGRELWMCYTDGCFWVSFLTGELAAWQTEDFIIMRSQNPDGSPSGEHWVALNSSSGFTTLGWAATYDYSTQTYGYSTSSSGYRGLLQPGILSGTIDPNTYTGVYPFFTLAEGDSRCRPNNSMVAFRSSEFPVATLFTAVPCGNTERTYVRNRTNWSQASSPYALGLVWEGPDV
jgi:hypothetical protein